jgi:hypothetical protein
MPHMATNSTYYPSEYVAYGHMAAGYSYMLAQFAAPYLDKIPASVTSRILPQDANGTLTATFSELFANNTRVVQISPMYGFSISLLPLAWLTLGVLVVVCYFLMLCLRGCCGKCRCPATAKKRSKKGISKMALAAEKLIEKAELYGQVDERALRLRDKAESERVHASITQQRKRISGLFMFFVLLQLAIGAGLTYISRTYFEAAFVDYDASLSNMLGMVSGWKARNGIISTDSALMQTAWEKVVCDATSDVAALLPIIDAINSPLPSLATALTSMEETMTSITSYKSQYLSEYREYGIYAIGGISVISSLLFATMVLVGPSKKHSLWRWSAMCGECVVCIYSILAVPLLLITFVLSDICIGAAPLDILSASIPSGISQNVTDLFLTCTNPLSATVAPRASGALALHMALQPLLQSPQVPGSTCPNDQQLIWLNETSVSFYSENTGLLPSFVGSLPSAECPTFGPLIHEGVEGNMCGATYDGIFVLTVSVTLCSFVTFICLYLMPFILSHYDYLLKVWDAMDNESESDSDDEVDADDLLASVKPLDSTILFGENKEDENNSLASGVSKVTEFDWEKLDLDAQHEHGQGKDPYFNPNSKPAQIGAAQAQHTSQQPGGATDDIDALLDMEANLQTKIKSVEDVLHYEAINEAGVEDDL